VVIFPILTVGKTTPMARSDLLISLSGGKAEPDPRFRSTVETIIAEERAKNHSALADQLADGVNLERVPASSVSSQIDSLLPVCPSLPRRNEPDYLWHRDQPSRQTN
jgi:hypothetical protein